MSNNQMRHYALDLETLGKGPTATIIGIGAVPFDIDTGVVYPDEDSFYTAVDPSTCMKFGLLPDGDTIMWWLRQSDEARLAVQDGTGIQQACIALAEFMAPEDYDGNVSVWGNGAAFDNVILASAFRETGIAQPWTYKHDMCGRTLRALRDLVGVDLTYGAPESDAVAHHALHDARWLAGQVVTIVRRLRRADYSFMPVPGVLVYAQNHGEITDGSELAESDTPTA